jgi:hypothetical protein
MQRPAWSLATALLALRVALYTGCPTCARELNRHGARLNLAYLQLCGPPDQVKTSFAGLTGPRAHLKMVPAHLGEPSAHLGEPSAHLSESSADLGESSAHLGEPSAHLDEPSARLGEPSAHLGE